MTGIHTYLLKLGPDMLGSAYSEPIDRRIAAALPSLNVRLRLQDVARLMADALAPALAAGPARPLHFINIAGGPAMDSLNALIVLRKEHPDAVRNREIVIEVLDLDDAGPAFGNSALEALTQAGAPLHGMNATFRYVQYNWAETARLTAALSAARDSGAIIVCSSEGGLFEYGSDDEIEANLKALRSPANVLAVVGSVTRSDELVKSLMATSPPGASTARAGGLPPVGGKSRLAHRARCRTAL